VLDRLAQGHRAAAIADEFRRLADDGAQPDPGQAAFRAQMEAVALVYRDWDLPLVRQGGCTVLCTRRLRRSAVPDAHATEAT